MPRRLESQESALVEAILAFPVDRPPEEIDSLRERLEDILRGVPQGEVSRLLARLGSTGESFSYFPPDPLARTINGAVADVVVGTAGVLTGGENLMGLENAPLIFLANHLSYADANVLSVLLERADLGRFADRLTVVAGPKVYSDPMRRFSSLCFGTIKTPQSSDLASAEAVMTVREVARVARETIALAAERQKGGDALLVFVEGTRSRTGSMQRALAAVARYFEADDLRIVPVGVAGTERLVPVEDERLHHAAVSIHLGHPGLATTLSEQASGSRRLMMDAVGVAIAALLPAEYRGAYADNETDLDDARKVARAVFGPG